MHTADCPKPRLLMWAGGFAPIGGVETLTVELACALQSRCSAPTVIAWGGPSEFLERMAQAGIEVRKCWWRWGCRWNLPDRLLLLRYAHEIQKADVIVFGKMLSETVQLKIMAARYGPVRFILITPYRPLEMWGQRPPRLDVLNSFDVIITQTPVFAEDLRMLGFCGEIRVLPYPPPEVIGLSPMPNSPELRVGFLGRLARQKNLPYLLESLELVLRRMPAHLHLFGTGPEHQHLKRLSLEMGISNKLTFHGAVSRADLSCAIDSCHLFAFSSVSEGQCLAALEVLSRGRPIIATPVGALPEILCRPELGLIAPERDARAFADRLISLGEAVLSKRLTSRAVQTAYKSDFKRASVLKEYVRVLTDTVHCKRL